jgi:integrase
MKYQPEPDRRAYHTQAKIQDQYDFTVLLLDTGVRHTEGSTLLWSAVDVVTWETVSIYRSKVYRESVLPISDRLRAILQRRWAESREGALWAYVFPGYDGTKRINKPRGHATLGIRKAITRAGLNRPHLVERYGPFTVHSLRHSFAAKMVQNGMPLHELRDLLGHTTVKTTERYAHLVPNQGAGRMRSILNKTAGEATTSTAVVAAKPTAPASPLAEVSL